MRHFIFILLCSGALFATDYSSMSLEELQSLKGTVPTEERSSYRKALQEKMQKLTPAQRRELNDAYPKPHRQNRHQGREERAMRGMM